MSTSSLLRATRRAGLSAVLAGLLAGPVSAADPPAAGADDGTAFEAAWSAAGRREVLRAGAREAVVARLSGSLAVVRGEGLGRGFRGEALFYSDGREVHRGTLVMTDARGDQLFSDLSGSPCAGGVEIRGTILGGTGAYAGASGAFSFRWRHLVKAADGEIQGVAEEFEGRFRKAPTSPEARP